MGTHTPTCAHDTMTVGCAFGDCPRSGTLVGHHGRRSHAIGLSLPDGWSALMSGDLSLVLCPEHASLVERAMGLRGIAVIHVDEMPKVEVRR